MRSHAQWSGWRALILALPLALFLTPARAQDAAEFLLRLDRLESENRRLNGQIEEMRFQLRRQEELSKRFQQDSDLRFRDLEGGKATPRPATPATPTTPQGPQRRSDAFDPAQSPSAPGAPRPLGPQGAATAPGAPLAAGSLPAGALPVEGGNPLSQPVAGDAKSEFEFARGLLTRGSNEQAEGAFRDFLRKYPRDRRIPDATFYLGESYLNRTRYRESAEHYLTVTSKHSGSARAPEAMLKLGISLRGLGAKQEACGTFDQLPKKYPKASPAVRAAVEREKGRAQC